MLFVLEGLDGAGKSTQVKKLAEYLRSRLGSLEYIHFPRYDAPVYGQLISNFLKGEYGSNDSVHPQLVALLFAEDRHGAKDAIKAFLDKGEAVLLDRYVYSNVAYQCAKMKDEDKAESLREWILSTEYGQFDLPRPDLNIFLDVPISFVESSLAANREGDDRTYLQGKQDIHESDIEFQKRVRNIYLRQASLDKDFLVIDCSDKQGRMLPPDKIFTKIKMAVDSRLNIV
ncbi:MAG: dTMP kinase [Bacteroidales bacterium]|nr:dTMP kinase [Bacteroidales bacterium]